MEIEIDFNPAEVDFAPSSTKKEIIQNVRMILTTMKRTVPFDRAFGIDGSIVDLPQPVAQARLTSDIVDAVRRYEPRASVVSVMYTGTEDGVLTGKVKVRINDTVA